MEVQWENEEDRWWDQATTNTYNLTVGPWSMIGKGVLDIDRLMWH